MDLDPTPVQSRYGLTRLGLLLCALACGLMAFDAAGHTLLMFDPEGGLRRVFESRDWLLWASTCVAWTAFLGSVILVARFDTPYWRSRTGILVLFALIGLVLWLIRHGDRFGLFAEEAPWPWLRMHAALGFRWVWIWTLADLSRRVAEHLGRDDTLKLHQIVRTLISLGIVAWGLLLLTNFQLAFGGGVMVPRRMFAFFLLQWLLFSASRAAACFAATILILLAARECRAFVAERKRTELEALNP